MDYEKKYNEALERAKEYMAKGYDVLMPEIFPELCESEDERIRKDIVAAVEMYKDFSQLRKGEICAWLEKQKEQKPAEWNFPYERNETADRLVSLAECLEMDGDCLFNEYSGTEYGKFLRELARKQIECEPEERFKEAREKYQVEWSEEDEKMMNRLIDRLNFIQYNTRTDGTSLNISFVNEIEWLKSLRPSWKPSEEQISSLKQARDYYMSGRIKYVGQHLSEIVEQLEKQM